MSRVSAKLNGNRLQYNKSLQHYLHQINPKAPSYVLSPGECQVAFQHWVAYVRGGDYGNTPDVTAKEHLRCPLLWCRESFDNLTSTLQHVSECPWLSNAWYWCPYCCRPESFTASEEPCVNPKQSNIQRKNSRLRRAVTFFKHLGHKSCSRHKTPRSSAPYANESFDTWFDTWLAEQQESELEDTSHKHSGRAELADSSSGVHVHQTYMQKRAGDVYEMEDTTSDISHDPSHSSWYTQGVKPTFQPFELDIESHTMGPQSRAELASPGNSFTSIGAQFEDRLRNAEPKEEMLVSPTSTVGDPSNYQDAEPITSRYSELESPSPLYKIPNSVSIPEVVHHRGCHDDSTLGQKEPSLTSENAGDLRGAVVLSTQSQVEDLRETVGILNKEWLRRCQSKPDLSLRTSMLSPQLLLEKGTQTLQLIYQDVLPGTFDATFALAHFACAAAYLMHRDNSSHCWNEFFQHILNLQNLLEHESDARLFVQLVNLLFRPLSSLTQHSCDICFLDESSGTLVPPRRLVLDLDGRSLAENIDSHTPRIQRKPDTMTFLHSLKSSAVFHECSSFLDGKLCLNIRSTSHDQTV